MTNEHSTSPNVALITGGSRGIGLGIARALAKDGVHLAINGMREEADVKDTLNELSSHGGDVIYCRGNIGESADRATILEKIKQQFGRLNILVNNAGVAPKVRKDMLEMDEQAFDRVMNVNVKGAFFLTQRIANWMIAQRGEDASFHGTVINISSISAVVASINRAEYCMAKAALSMTTQLWATRLTEHNIATFEIRPGLVATDMTSAPHVRERYDKLIEEGLLLDRRWGEPADIGAAVAMLCRGELRYAPGQVLTLDGGLTTRRL